MTVSRREVYTGRVFLLAMMVVPKAPAPEVAPSLDVDHTDEVEWALQSDRVLCAKLQEDV